MSRLLIKIFAVFVGLGTVAYLMKRNLKVWELEVIDPPPSARPKIKAPPPPVKKQSAKKPKTTSKDNLKKIKGVGPAIEKQLHALGIHTFQQIAELSPQEIEKIDGQMNGFSGRLERDKWIEQAKVLRK